MTGRVLIAGASGLVGHAACERFAGAGHDVVAVSRRRVELPGVDWRRLDLLDEDACHDLAGELGDVTHVVYAALQESPGLFAGWIDDELIDRNARMVRNLFAPLVEAATGLEQVSLMHGTKAYGVHHPELGLDGLHMPLRERDPLRPHRNFYFEQERYLHELFTEGGVRLTTLRPTVVYGTAAGNNMNPMLPIVAYGLIQRELGEPLHFPGAFANHLREAVDASLLADVLVWLADAPGVDGEAFNVTNGDVFTWGGVWPAIADALGMEVGEDRPLLLADWLPAHADVWSTIVSDGGDDGGNGDDGGRADIVEFLGANSLVYADLVLGSAQRRTDRAPQVIVNSTIKLRHAGFGGCIDTSDMFAGLTSTVVGGWDVASRSPTT